MRAIAVLLVLAIHLGGVSGANTDAWYGVFTSRGNLGVTLFFLISGFLLHRPYAAAQLDGRASPALARYAKRRALRILPAYWLALTILIQWPGLDGVFRNNWWVYYALLNSYDVNWMFSGIQVTWSLSVEVAFYAVLPLLAAGLARVGGADRDARAHRQLALLALLGGAALCLRSWAWMQQHYAVPWTLPALFLWFALGMALAIVHVQVEGDDDRTALSRLGARAPGACWGLAVALFVALSLLPGIPRGMTGQYTLFTYTAEHLLFGAVAFLMLLPAVFGETRGGWPRRLLALPGLTWIGTVSYGVFLWHHPLLMEMGRRGLAETIPGAPFLSLALFLVPVSLACGAISYYAIERPLLRLR